MACGANAMSKFIVGHASNEIFMALHNAGVFADEPSEVRRVIIDLEVGSAARIYVEKFADSSLVDVIMSGAVEIVEREKAAGQ